MPLVYPTSRADDEEPNEEVLNDPELGYSDFASDWSETWILELHTSPDHDHDDPETDEAIRIGPMEPRAAWDLANDLEAQRSDWAIIILPLFEPESAESIISQIEEG